MFHQCKVTVIKKTCNMEIVHEFVKDPDNFTACSLVKDHQEFIITNPYIMPEGICPHAWADIRPQILAIASGGSFAFLKKQNMNVATCTDPFRPVLFTIERIEE